jgi:hypothetical protein
MESNAGGMVRRLALKTRFSEMGWGSTPLLSANFRLGSANKISWFDSSITLQRDVPWGNQTNLLFYRELDEWLKSTVC